MMHTTQGSGDPRSETIVAGGTLTDRVTEVLLQKIRSGEFAVNDRLPTELALAQRFEVSRTVIREAVSRLKSEGLVETRQGSGTVVVEPSLNAPFRIELDAKDLLQAVLRVVELRRGLEGEMAALAAERRSEEQNAAIREAALAIDRAVSAGGDGVDEDLAFHAAISAATGNPLYTSLLSFLSQYLREGVRVGRMNEAFREDVIGQLRQEHGAIVDAIARRDAAAARAAAGRHLDNVAMRLRNADAGFWTSKGGEIAHRLARTGVGM